MMMMLPLMISAYTYCSPLTPSNVSALFLLLHIFPGLSLSVVRWRPLRLGYRRTVRTVEVRRLLVLSVQYQYNCHARFTGMLVV